MKDGLEAGSSNNLRLPDEPERPGGSLGFDALNFDQVGVVERPNVDCAAADIRELAWRLIRVTDDNGQPQGPWQPNLNATDLQHALRAMLVTRSYDEHMFRLQRQGKLSFFMKSSGEEAIGVGQALALDDQDMLFPSYRQLGLFIARGDPLEELMCQCFSNTGDKLDGKQLPVLGSWGDGNIFSISGNVGTQFSQAVGWAMASAYRGDSRIAATWVGDGSSAEGDVHNAMLFAATFQAPVVMNIVNNQWAISTPQTVPSCGTSFAARGVGYNLPCLRVDGNDLLAVYAVTAWAAERARTGYGATLIELLTYRQQGHSSSDDPKAYREQRQAWPMGDPIERLQQHLIAQGEWSEAQQTELAEQVNAEVKAAAKKAEAQGSIVSGPLPGPATMFEQVYAELPAHLKTQQQEALQWQK